MGQRIQACLPDHPALKLTVAVGLDTPDSVHFGDCDVVIDFAVAEATEALFRRLTRPVALVTGVTGRNKTQQARLSAWAERAPVFEAANFSLGVAVTAWLVEQAAQMLGAPYDVELFELHHRRKVDAPSGTALHLGAAAARGSGRAWPESRAQPRDGHTGPRGDDLGIAALRGGDVIGEHTVFFLGAHDRIEITHRAADRQLFADGALRAAVFCAKKLPGLYRMTNLIAPGAEVADDPV